MRKLLNTLYVMTESCYLTLDGENIVISDGEKKLGRFPLHTLENIICFTYKGATPALMGACAERQIGMSFFSPRGVFLARTVGKEYGNVLLRKEQYRISDDSSRSVTYARNMIVGKVFNSRWSIERTLRDHAYRVDSQKLKGYQPFFMRHCRKLTVYAVLTNCEEWRERRQSSIFLCLTT